MSLFNWLIVKPVMYLSRQVQGMKKGTETADQILKRIGPGVSIAISLAVPLIDKRLALAESDLIGLLNKNAYSPDKIEGIIRDKFKGIIGADITDFVVAKVLEKGLPAARDATYTKIEQLVQSVMRDLEQMSTDAATGGRL